MLECTPQLVISDWIMPNMDGIAFCESLRTTRDGRGLYFIILTALADEDRLVEAFEAGVDDYLVKPYSVKVLMARLRAGQRLIQLKEEMSPASRKRCAGLHRNWQSPIAACNAWL